MRKLCFTLIILFTVNLYSNPVIISPVISEFCFNDGINWQMEIYFNQEILNFSGLPSMDNFDHLCLQCDAGLVYFNPGIPFSWDTLYVIDQSWLSSTFQYNLDEDVINILYSDGGTAFMFCTEISYSSGSMYSPAPGPGESIAIQNVYTMGGGTWPEYFHQMIQSPPTIGSCPFNVTPNCSFSGYVFDQNQNPLEGVEFAYCEPGYCYGYSTPVFHCFQTDETGYFECDSLFPMYHAFDLTYEGYVYLEDVLVLNPNQPVYQEYTLLTVGIIVDEIQDKAEIYAAPNPFSHKTTFHISIPEELSWNEGRVTIYNVNGQAVDFIPLARNPWAGGEIRADWLPDNAMHDIGPGLYLYTLEVDGKFIASEKMIIRD